MVHGRDFVDARDCSALVIPCPYGCLSWKECEIQIKGARIAETFPAQTSGDRGFISPCLADNVHGCFVPGKGRGYPASG